MLKGIQRFEKGIILKALIFSVIMLLWYELPSRERRNLSNRVQSKEILLFILLF